MVSLLSRPHHDGSCVVQPPAELGDEAVVRLRAPRATPLEGALVRYVIDGEPRGATAEVDEETDADVWWRASFPVENPATRYRWLLTHEDGRTEWLNGLGAAGHDVGDDGDFVIRPGSGGPDWHLGSVVYEIFPDRFASSGLDVEPPDWVLPRNWDDLPTGRGPETPFEWFGGDLRGIEHHLDHVESLGASLLYLTPIFPAGTTHRYDSTSFDRIDPLLGGDEALSSLVQAARARGMRIVGDLTLNHVGSGHEWFRAALADPRSPERGFFYFDDALPNGYASWMGVPHLPKLDQRSEELRRRLARVIAHWVGAPFELDGWRIDVANMTGRFRDIDLNAQVARGARETLVAARPDGLLVAEHGHDPRKDLCEGGWHGVMNYSGFLRPVWSWLRESDRVEDSFYDVATASLAGPDVVAGMTIFRSGLPWTAVLHSWTLLSSHDTPRLASVVPSRDRRIVAIGLQMTAPGVPMLFAGDELGLEGAWGEDGRRTMPWSRPETWDRALLAEYRRLIALRRSSEALARGGIRFAWVDDAAIAYLRETADEQVLCLAARASHEPVRLPLDELGAARAETLYGGDAEVESGTLVLPADGPAFHAWRLEE
jgi:alpha-glucosidase